jgi:hypothetical protein
MNVERVCLPIVSMNTRPRTLFVVMWLPLRSRRRGT